MAIVFFSNMSYKLLSYTKVFALIFLVIIGCNDDGENPEPDPLEQAYQNSESWHWIPKDEMISRTGLKSGYGVNFVSNSSKLLIYLEGGGACFNDLTCLANASKFDEGDFEERLITQGQGSTGIYNRENAGNPFSDWNFVYVPYTTGDVHSGDNTETKRVGYRNITVVINDIAPFLLNKGVDEVFLCGASGGGYGAIINYDQIAQAFDGIDISMMADSSPIFFDTETFTGCLNEKLENTFSIHFPEDFQSYTTDTYPYKSQRFYEYLSNKYPSAQFGFFSYYQDQTMEYFFGFGLDDCSDQINPIEDQQFKSGIIQIADEIESLGNWKVYFDEGDEHTILFSNAYKSLAINNIAFSDWMGQLNQKIAGSVKK